MALSKSYLDSAYRGFLNGQYTKQGFTTFRMYIDGAGNSFVSIACFYCGDMANSEDHTLPLLALSSLLAAEAKISRDTLVTVPACSDCNASLGTKIFPTLTARKDYIKQRLRKRFKRVLVLPIWHEDELRELGPTLKSAVLQGLALQRKVKARLAW